MKAPSLWETKVFGDGSMERVFLLTLIFKKKRETQTKESHGAFEMAKPTTLQGMFRKAFRSFLENEVTPFMA